jgi:thiamine pyrophosphokinase
MPQGICYVAGAGECSRLKLNIKEEDYVIAVDGGYKFLEGNRIDLVIGDFDSLGFVPEHSNVIPLKPEKDDTDMLAALKEGLKRGYKEFRIYGGCGGRLDHTIANIQSLAFLAEHEARGELINDKQSIIMLKNDTMVFPSCQKGMISIFAYGGKATGVTLKGFQYTMENGELSDHFPLGVSNEFIGRASEITVKNGRLLILYDHNT